MTCPLCLALFKELCYTYGHEQPVLCQIYEDYALGRVSGELPLQYAIKVAGWDKFRKARKSLVEQGILKE